MADIKQFWGKTAGYKTVSGGVLLVLFQLFQLIWPEALSMAWKDLVYNAIGIFSATGVGDKVVRNRQEIRSWIINKFKKKNDERDEESVIDNR